MGTLFRFKQFEVEQQGCAMKINTDGVLLGALVEIESSNLSPQLLDLGTGTGVIALMVAQKYCDAKVFGVDIDQQAYERAKQNFEESPFSARLSAVHGSFTDLNGRYSWDAIISNPPFYTNSLHNPDNRKKLARHTDFSFFSTLLDFAAQNLNDRGSLTLIVPPELGIFLQEEGSKLGLYKKKTISLRSFSDTEVIRTIITLCKGKVTGVEWDDFVIYKERGVYSDRYKEVLKPYFLAF